MQYIWIFDMLPDFRINAKMFFSHCHSICYSQDNFWVNHDKIVLKWTNCSRKIKVFLGRLSLTIFTNLWKCFVAFRLNYGLWIGSVGYEMFRSSNQRCSVRKGIFRNFVSFTGKHLRWNLFLIKLLAWIPGALLLRDSKTDNFLWNLWNF